MIRPVRFFAMILSTACPHSDHQPFQLLPHRPAALESVKIWPCSSQHFQARKVSCIMSMFRSRAA